MASVEKIKNNTPPINEVFVLESSKAMVSFVGDNDGFSANRRTGRDVIKKGDFKIVKWGLKNRQPYEYTNLVKDNDIKPALISTLVDLGAGTNLSLYKTELIDGKKEIKLVEDSEITAWLEDFMAYEFVRETIRDLETYGNSWAQFTKTGDEKTMVVDSLNAVDCRLGESTKKRFDSERVYVADWLNPKIKKEDIKGLPLLPIRRPASELGKTDVAAMHIKQILSGYPYYTPADWHGTQDWCDVANVIPKFHKAGLKNGYMMRYHIKIPATFFAQYGTKEKQEEKKKEIREMFDQMLSAEDNAHKTFFSYTEIVAGTPMEWKIEKVETDLKDDSYIKLHELASKVHARGHNLHPVLAGIGTSGELSSGSEILNLLNFHIAYKTPGVRSLALKPLMLAKNYTFPNKKDIHIGVQDVVLTTTDKNPKGREAAQVS